MENLINLTNQAIEKRVSFGYSIATGETCPNTGYLLTISDGYHFVVPEEEDLLSKIKEFAMSYIDDLVEEDNYIVCFYNDDLGVFSLDVSRHFYDINEMKAYGIEHDKRAVWDLTLNGLINN